jgi:hypothetical protein
VGVEIAQSVLRPATGRTAVVRFSAEATDFSLLHSVQTRSGTHPVTYKMDIGLSFPEARRPEREYDHSPPASAEVNNGAPLYSPICLYGLVTINPVRNMKKSVRS